jgi:AcrR family transcriptional regulator
MGRDGTLNEQTPDGVTPPAGQGRRVPRQARSRQRVEDILDATSRLVLERGVDALSTRSIAEAAQVPVASLYQYFADKESVLLSLVDRDMAEMDEQVLADLAEADPSSIGEVVATTMRAFTKVYARRPAFVEIWLRGRGNAAIRRRGREHNTEVAETLRTYAVESGLTTRDVPPVVAMLAVEVGDRVFQIAYESDIKGDPEVVEEGIRMVTAYLHEYAA